MKNKFICSILLIFACNLIVHAQTNTRISGNTISNPFGKTIKKARYNIAVLTPLYLDSFDLAKSLTELPSYAIPGLNFYTGAMIAADTLNGLGSPINLFIYDSKSKYLNIAALISTDKLDSMDCIIGNIGGPDLKTIVEFANEHKINFFSAVSPADAEQTNNPYFTLLQPRLNTHVERIHKKIQLSHAGANTIFAHRNIASENNAYQYYTKDPFTQSTKPTTEMIVEETGIDEVALKAKLNKNEVNILILGILDARAAYNNLKIIATIAAEGYKIKVFGMPTWESIKALKDPNEFPDLEIVYTSPIMVENNSNANKYIQNAYKQKMASPVTDIVYKAFESVYFASHMLNRYGTPFNQSLTEAVPTFVTPYKIQEVKENFKLKYFENKFLYLIKYKDGLMSYE